MHTNQFAAGHPAGAGRSRLVVHSDDQQEVAEGLFMAAAQLAAVGIESGDLPLFDHLSSIARSKGFQHSALILSLAQQPCASHCIRSLIQDAIICMGGPGDFFDALDLISAPETGSIQ